MLSHPTRTRAAALLATAALVVTAGAAHSAPSCARVLDPTGDGGGVAFMAGEYLPNDPALDLIELDVASRQRDLVAQIRLLRVDRTIDRMYAVLFTIGGTEFFLNVDVPSQTADAAPHYTIGYFTGDSEDPVVLDEIRGSLDTARSTITFLADSRLLHPLATVRDGTVLREVRALSYRVLPVGWTATGADKTSELEYRFGGRACFSVPRS